MFNVETQIAYSFEELSAFQFGWDFEALQLSTANAESSATLYRTANVGYTRFLFSTAYEQRIVAQDGFVSFGILEPDNPLCRLHDLTIPNDGIAVFPRHEYIKAVSPAGLCGNGMHFRETFLEGIADQVYRRPLSTLLPAPGMYLSTPRKLEALRAELLKWQILQTHCPERRLPIISRREESLALAILDCLVDAEYETKGELKKSHHSMIRALEIIHESELENISTKDLCIQVDCSQRTLETIFLTRFGVTPKKYIKCLRLAQVHQELKRPRLHDHERIVDLAGAHGFWHMGQFAADYRKIYGELPRDTLGQRRVSIDSLEL
ncbi:MAG: helix-turn-helix domain-containing protein [Pseudomonadales bacterium]